MLTYFLSIYNFPCEIKLQISQLGFCTLLSMHGRARAHSSEHVHLCLLSLCREKMRAMEEQIASLTGLVQHALLKGPSINRGDSEHAR